MKKRRKPVWPPAGYARKWTPADLAAKAPTADDLQRLKVDDLILVEQLGEDAEE